MKGLFVVFHGFSAHSGISKKIFAQCDALRRNGADIELCHIEIAPDGTQRRMVGGQAIRTFGKGLRAKLEKRVSLSDITRYIRHEGVEFLYIRHDHNASPVLIHWLRKVKKLGVRIALEIPTYPYDAEFAQSPAVRKLKLRIDRMFRCRMARYIDRIVTFSDDTEIFGRPTIRISNGIDFRSIPLKTQGSPARWPAGCNRGRRRRRRLRDGPAFRRRGTADRCIPMILPQQAGTLQEEFHRKVCRCARFFPH